jgi:hypothetical protein
MNREGEADYKKYDPSGDECAMQRVLLVLVHGTWSDGKLWTEENTFFCGETLNLLRKLNFDPVIRRILWSSKNDTAAREMVRTELGSLLSDWAEMKEETPILIVAHSHGGNIATDAVRDALTENNDLPVIGIICMNTPFMKQEVRTSTSYLRFWSFLALILLLVQLWWSTVWSVPVRADPSIFTETARWAMTAVSIATFVVLLCLIRLGKVVDKADGIADYRNPVPDVLCLSCPDDEAISLLGLAEGLSNLTQIAFHPWALALYLVSGAALSVSMQMWGSTSGRLDLGILLQWMHLFFVIWTASAITVSAIASVFLSKIFGLSRKEAVESMVARTLVSYVPLKPAVSVFRAVNELNLGWRHCFGLFHSSIYNSKDTIREIAAWLHRQIRMKAKNGISHTGISPPNTLQNRLIEGDSK